MAAFEYEALDSRGHLRRGVIEGDTPRRVRQTLRHQALIPLSVIAAARKQSQTALVRGRLTTAELALITRQLSTMLRSGATLAEALDITARQNDNKRSQRLLMTLRSGIMEGRSLADSCADFPATFTTLYRATIAAGEHSGALDIVLEQLADYTEFRSQLRQKITMAMIYPVLLTVVAILIVSGLIAFVVPQVVSVFINTGQQLPLLTRILIVSSAWLQQHIIILIPAALLLVFLGRLALRQENNRLRLHTILLMIPLISKLIVALETAGFTRAFSILTASGTPVLEGLRISGQVMNNLVMREAVKRAVIMVREGSSLSEALRQGNCFPPTTIHLIASGEAGAELDKMLEQAAAGHEREIQTLTGTLLALFEPLLILIMGGVVLFIVLAIMLPIFNLNQLVK